MRGCLITLVVLLALAVGIDYGARWVAQDQIATQLQRGLELPAEPDVTIRGFPFLTQALSGRFGEAELSAPDISFGELRDLTLTATLQGVTLPLDSVFAGQVDTIPAETVVAEARVSPADLASLLDVPDVTVEPVTRAELDDAIAAAEADGSGLSGDAGALRDVEPESSVRLRSTQQVAGQEVPVAVISSFDVDGGQVTLSARDVSTDAEVPGPAAEAAAGALRDELVGRSVTVDPGELPFGIRPTALRAEDGMLVVAGTAQDVDVLGGP